MPLDKTLTPQRREIVDSSERDRLGAAGALAIDPRCTFPRYFDGRYLAARDLTADQEYVRTRHADLGRAAGWGVVEGLVVRAASLATEVTISAGLAVTPSGETVVLPSELTVDVQSLRQSDLLDAHLGLRSTGSISSRVRTGAFVLALRPVEFSANPRRGYPTSVTGDRTVEDHEIVEASAITLVPWPSSLAGSATDARRQLVREIFVSQRGLGLKADLVPLALLFLDGVGIRFIDVHLVRRAIGSEQEDLLGLGGVPRAVRTAHVRQYGEQLREILGDAGDRALTAADHFDVLPPVGELPAAAVHRSEFTESFFPAQVEVDLSIVPLDELPLLLEETLMLPPIDLRAPASALQSIEILVLAPIARERYRAFKQALADVRRNLVPRALRYARPATLPLLRPALLGSGLPSTFELLAAKPFLPALQPVRTEPLATLSDPESAAWTQVLDEAAAASGGLFWYVRRPNFSARADLEGALIDIDVVASVLRDGRPA